MQERTRLARVAGLLYLAEAVTGVFDLIYVPGKLVVGGDAAATAARILAAEPLFRTAMLVELISNVAFLFATLALYQLLREVHRTAAVLMVILVAVQIPLVLLDEVAQAAALILLHAHSYLSVFDQAQREALAMLALDANSEATISSELFWGLWLLPLGWLVFRSGFLPRLLGIWLAVNGLVYIAMCVIGLLLPQQIGLANRIAFPFLMGEPAFILWLLAFGAKAKATANPASAPA